MEIPIEFIIIFCALTSGLSFFIGSFVSPRTKNLKAEIKYLEGKYHRLRQDTKDNNDTFDLGSIFGGGGTIGNILKFVEKNPQILQKILGGSSSAKQDPTFELR